MSREAKADDDDDDDDDDKDKDTVIGGFDSKNFVLHQRLWESGTSVKKPKAEQQLDGSTCSDRSACGRSLTCLSRQFP